MKTTGKIIRLCRIGLAAGLFLQPAAICPLQAGEAAAEPIPSYKYIMVYGTGELATGDVVEFFDPEGTLCGRFVVEEAGGYGLMPVYGDDPMTSDIDEGAKEGNYLTIRVNGREVYPSGGSPIWGGEVETQRVDL